MLISWSIKILNWNKFNMAAMCGKKFTWFQVSEITPCLYITTRRKPTYHCWANAFKKEWSICGSFIVVGKLKNSNSLNRMRTCTLHFIVIVIINFFIYDGHNCRIELLFKRNVTTSHLGLFCWIQWVKLWSIICTYWLSGRAGRENIWLEVRAYGPSAARSVPPNREPNISPSGPTILSQ